MDANSNLHFIDTPDALPQHRDRAQDILRTDALLRETMTRVEDLAQSRDTNKDDRRASFHDSSVEEMLNVL